MQEEDNNQQQHQQKEEGKSTQPGPSVPTTSCSLYEYDSAKTNLPKLHKKKRNQPLFRVKTRFDFSATLGRSNHCKRQQRPNYHVLLAAVLVALATVIVTSQPVTSLRLDPPLSQRNTLVA